MLLIPFDRAIDWSRPPLVTITLRGGGAVLLRQTGGKQSVVSEEVRFTVEFRCHPVRVHLGALNSPQRTAAWNQPAAIGSKKTSPPKTRSTVSQIPGEAAGFVQ